MKKTTEYTTVKDMKEFEVISPEVSEKYVPIFSTEIIEGLAPEFEFDGAVKFGAASSAHFFDLKTKSGDRLRIYNSYDRTLALRVSLISDGVQIPLGLNRLVHIGQKAKTFTEDFKEAKAEIIEAIKTAKIIDVFLTTTQTTKETAEKLNELVYVINKDKKLKTAINPVMKLIELEQGINLKQFIKKTITNFLVGEFTYINEDGKTLKGTKQNTILTRIRTENKIVKFLKEENPELFL